MSKITFVITDEVLSNKEYLQPLKTDGAKLCFRGYVRDNNPYEDLKHVIAIDYSCYKELAQKEGKDILQRALKHSAVDSIFCIHRIGRIELQEASIHVEITSAHRAQGFAAIEFIMNEIKKSLPIWKQEITAEGTRIWT